jgi:signal transduction histidine kinase
VNGKLIGRFALHRNVTKELRFIARTEARADLPDINPIPLFKCDALGRVLFQNDAAERFLLGLGLDPTKAQRMFPHDYRRRIKTAVSEHQGAQVFEHRYKTRTLTFTLSPHPRLPHCMILVDDVTEQRQAAESMKRYAAELESTNRELRETQMALVQTEKMASLGNLVAGVAHEINTPVGAVSSNADLMRRALNKLRQSIGESRIHQDRDLDRAFTALEHVASVNREACERIVKIVRGLRNFARLDEAERKRVDLHEGIESTLTLLHHELKKRIEVVREFGHLPEIECFPSQLNQVFMNLLVNAIQAIDGEGRITIRTSASDAHVRLEFHDSGRGVPPDVLPRIFDPGFTTKGVGVGSGLGLAICYQIVHEDHGGEIRVDSKTRDGTTFTVTLPLQELSDV